MADQPFTHILVGAGSAGCVVAARIAENKAFNVLLLEAGPDYCSLGSTLPSVEDSRRVPMRGQSEHYDPAIDWNLSVSLPDGSSMTVPQAKLVGGGSSINGGTALRNTEADSREWVDMGNLDWNFDNVRSVYDSLERDELRGTRGIHPIMRVKDKESGRIQRAFRDAALETGFRLAHDLNETGAEGVGPSPVCRQGSKRVSAANTFLDPRRHWANLTFRSCSHVDHVIFSAGDFRRATGVLLTSGETIQASKEVVLCAGAIFSPAILQRSGIGPARLLSSVSIPCIVDSPVGSHLSDHPCIPIVARVRPGAYSSNDYSLQWQARWSSSFRPYAIDHQLVCFSYLFMAAPMTTPSPTHSEAKSKRGPRSLGGTSTGHVAGLGCNLNKPTSLGTVRVTSQDPNVQPHVSPNYLSTSHDRASAREIVRKGFEILTSPKMQEVLEMPQNLTQETVNDDDLLDEYVVGQLTSTYHFTGSCRMAPASFSSSSLPSTTTNLHVNGNGNTNPNTKSANAETATSSTSDINSENPAAGGVVDQQGRVHGVQGLRVADASIIPTIPASNTMWTTMMFAERIGSWIRDSGTAKL